MDEQTKRKLIHKYFQPSIMATIMIVGSWFFVFTGIWIILVFPVEAIASNEGITIAEMLMIIVTGIFPLAIGIFGIRMHNKNNKGKVSDQQIDEWFEDDLERLEKISLDKLGIDETELISDPVPITGMSLWGGDNTNIMFRKGKDKILRFTPIEINILNFTQNQLLIYRCVFNFTTGKISDEKTEEYFYKDVVSISTRVERGEKINTKKFGVIKLNAAKMLTLNTSGSTSFAVLLYDPMLVKKLGGGKIPTIQAERAIQVVRKMLRDKKV